MVGVSGGIPGVVDTHALALLELHGVDMADQLARDGARLDELFEAALTHATKFGDYALEALDHVR